MTTATPIRDDAIRVYWQPGCTSCLRTKEFRAKNGVPFLSRNVLADDAAFEELKHFGLRQVPIDPSSPRAPAGPLARCSPMWPGWWAGPASRSRCCRLTRCSAD